MYNAKCIANYKQRGEGMDIWAKVVKKNNEVIDILSAKLKTNQRDDSRPLVHNAFSDDAPVSNVPVAVSAPRRKTETEIAVEECERILQSILDGDTANVQSKLIQVVVKCDTVLPAQYDMAEMYTRVCMKLRDQNVDIPIACVNAYLELYTTRFNPAHCGELLDITEAYFKAKYADEYEKGAHGTPIDLYKILNKQLRDKIAAMK